MSIPLTPSSLIHFLIIRIMDPMYDERPPYAIVDVLFFVGKLCNVIDEASVGEIMKAESIVRKALAQENGHDAYIQNHKGDIRKLDDAVMLFEEPAGAGANGYPHAQQVLDEMIFFLPMAPKVIQTAYLSWAQRPVLWPGTLAAIRRLPRRIGEILKHDYARDEGSVVTLELIDNLGNVAETCTRNLEDLMDRCVVAHLRNEMTHFDNDLGVCPWTQGGGLTNEYEEGFRKVLNVPKYFWPNPYDDVEEPKKVRKVKKPKKAKEPKRKKSKVVQSPISPVNPLQFPALPLQLPPLLPLMPLLSHPPPPSLPKLPLPASNRSSSPVASTKSSLPASPRSSSPVALTQPSLPASPRSSSPVNPSQSQSSQLKPPSPHSSSSSPSSSSSSSLSSLSSSVSSVSRFFNCPPSTIFSQSFSKESVSPIRPSPLLGLAVTRETTVREAMAMLHLPNQDLCVAIADSFEAQDAVYFVDLFETCNDEDLAALTAGFSISKKAYVRKLRDLYLIHKDKF